MERDEAIREIRAALKRRSGHAWSVTGGRGTGWGWIHIAPMPRDCRDPAIKEARRKELNQLLGSTGDDFNVPASYDYRREYVDRANGRTPSVKGTMYWD